MSSNGRITNSILFDISVMIAAHGEGCSRSGGDRNTHINKANATNSNLTILFCTTSIQRCNSNSKCNSNLHNSQEMYLSFKLQNYLN